MELRYVSSLFASSGPPICPVDYKTARERITLLLYLPQYLTTQRVLILFLSKSPDIHTLCTGAPRVLHPKCYTRKEMIRGRSVSSSALDSAERSMYWLDGRLIYKGNMNFSEKTYFGFVATRNYLAIDPYSRLVMHFLGIRTPKTVCNPRSSISMLTWF